MTDGWSFDPRPDLADDSRLWRYLITAACRRDGGHQGALYGALRCLRQMGARLVLEGGEARLEAGGVGHAYTIYRKMWLLPNPALMSELLGLLADAAALDLLDQVPYRAEASELGGPRARRSHGARLSG